MNLRCVLVGGHECMQHDTQNVYSFVLILNLRFWE